MTSKVPIVLVDIDGTLADNDARFAHYFPDDALTHDWSDSHWTDYDKACFGDAPIPYVVEIVNTLALSYEIQLITGRHDVAEPETTLWLEAMAVDYDGLSMRAPGDYSRNPVFKRAIAEMFLAEGREIHLVIDDHPGVIAELGELGIDGLHVQRPSSWNHRHRSHG